MQRSYVNSISLITRLSLSNYNCADDVEPSLLHENKSLGVCDGRQQCQGGMVMKRIGTYKDHCILPLLGIASNKLRSEGYLTKYNARICVRYNLWATAEDTDSARQTSYMCLALAAITASSTWKSRNSAQSMPLRMRSSRRLSVARIERLLRRESFCGS